MLIMTMLSTSLTCGGRALSKVLTRISELKDVVQEFMIEKKNQACRRLQGSGLTFPSHGISSHLHELNLNLQSEDQLVHVLFHQQKLFI